MRCDINNPDRYYTDSGRADERTRVADLVSLRVCLRTF